MVLRKGLSQLMLRFKGLYWGAALAIMGLGLASSAGLATPPAPAASNPVSATSSSTTPDTSGAKPYQSLKPYVASSSDSSPTSANPAPKAVRPKPALKPNASTIVPPGTPPSGSTLAPYMDALPSAPSSKIATPKTAPATQFIPPATVNARPISVEDIETFTDSAVRTLMARDHVLGVSVAVVQGDTPILIKGYGYDRLNPARAVDPQTSMFRLGSVTKVFTWILARQEIEAKRIGLDDPISPYLPSDIFAEDRRYKPITLRALMTHSAGFDDTSLGHIFQLNPNRLDTVDSYMRVHRPRRVREPLLFSSYSNYGAELAALALTKTSRARDVPSLMDARIFNPMGMTSTTLREPYPTDVATAYRLPSPLPLQRAQNVSDGFLFNGTDYVRQPFEYGTNLSGALSGSSSASDMAKLMSLMLGGGHFGSTQLYGGSSATAFATPMQKRPEGFNGWASGLMIRKAPTGQTTYGHSGATLWFSSQLVLVPELNLGIFITANTQGGENLTRTYPDLLLAHLSGETMAAPIVPSPAKSYADNRPFYRAIAREYVSTRRAYGGLEGAVTRLLNTVSVKIEPDGRLVLRTYNGVSTYVPATADGFFKAQNREDVGPARDFGVLHFLMDTERNRVSAIETSANLMRFEPINGLMSPGFLSFLSICVTLSALVLWLGLIRGYTRQERPSEGQARATLISAAVSALWVMAILLVWHWKSQIEADPTALFTRWPNGQVRLASLMALLASLGSLYQLGSVYFIFVEDRRFNDGWAFWQKIAHTVLMAFWLCYGILLAAWGGLNPFA